MFGFCKFCTSLNTFIVEKPLMNKFCAARLYCEVVLGESNLSFTEDRRFEQLDNRRIA